MRLAITIIGTGLVLTASAARVAGAANTVRAAIPDTFIKANSSSTRAHPRLWNSYDLTKEYSGSTFFDE